MMLLLVSEVKCGPHTCSKNHFIIFRLCSLAQMCLILVEMKQYCLFFEFTEFIARMHPTHFSLWV